MDSGYCAQQIKTVREHGVAPWWSQRDTPVVKAEKMSGHKNRKEERETTEERREKKETRKGEEKRREDCKRREEKRRDDT